LEVCKLGLFLHLISFIIHYIKILRKDEYIWVEEEAISASSSASGLNRQCC
jgi:hypothetical protein